MHIDVSESSSHEFSPRYEREHLGVSGSYCQRKIMEERENLIPVSQVATGELADHEWMHQNEVVLQRGAEARPPPTHVVNPHRGVGQNHFFAGRRRGTGRSCG